MNPETITKFVNKILNSEDDEAIYYSNLQFEYFSNQDDFMRFFSLLAKSNLVVASFIFLNYQQKYKFNNTYVQHMLLSRIYKQSNQLVGDVINLQDYKADDENYIKLTSKINQIAELCISDVLICNDKSLHDKVFYSNVFRITRNEICYKVFLSRCSELLSLLDNQNRCTGTIKLITKLLDYFCNDYNNLLLIVLRCLSIRPLRFYGEISSVMINCILAVYKFNNPFILRQLLELFPQVDFNMLKTDLKAFLNLSETCTSHRNYESNIIQLVKCAKILNSRDTNAISTSDFRKVVYEHYAEVFAKNRSLEQSVDALLLCIAIKEEPTNLDYFLKDTIDSEEIISKALDDVEQEAFLSLVRENPQGVLLFLKRLNTANAFRLNFIVREPDINNASYYKSQLCRLSPYYDDKDLAYIYFNSHLRFSLPIEELLRIVYDKSSVKRDDYMAVAHTFSDYKINGILIRDKTGVYVKTNQFISKFSSLAMAGHERISKNDVNRILYEKNGEVLLSVEACNISADFNPIVVLYIPGENTRITSSKKAAIDMYVNHLKRIAYNGTYTDSDISKLSQMPRKFSRAQDYEEIGILVLQCCNSFSNIGDAISFLNRNPHFPYKMQKNYESKLRVNFPLNIKNFNFCKTSVENIALKSGSLEEKLYIYFNTILRRGYNLDAFLFRVAPKREQIELWPFYDIYNYTFLGKIVSITNEEITIRPYSFNHYKDWSIVYNEALDGQSFVIGDNVSFDLYKADKNKKLLYAENINKTSVRFTRFCDGMKKASLTLELTEKDYFSFKRCPSGLTQKEMERLAFDEIMAIKQRLSSSEILLDFLSVIEENNPWTFSEKAIPCVIHNNESNKYLIESTINDLVDNYPIELANRIFFNTSLKSVFTIDNYVRRQIKRHKNVNMVISSLSYYFINIIENDSKLTANIHLDDQHYSKVKAGKYEVVGFDKDNHIITIYLKN